jgi:RNA polymerase sigma factor (sigma-70 family)
MPEDGIPDTKRTRIMTPPIRIPESELVELVSAARSGDSLAWSRLVQRLDGTLRGVARSYRLSPEDVDDSVQATWVTLYEHMDSVRDASAIVAWLVTTVRRQSLRTLQRRVREVVTDGAELACDDMCVGPETRLLDSERRHVLTRALATLPDRHRRLMAMIASEDGGSYEQMGAELDMPVGSIGPIRARSMTRLQEHPELRAYAMAG